MKGSILWSNEYWKFQLPTLSPKTFRAAVDNFSCFPSEMEIMKRTKIDWLCFINTITFRSSHRLILGRKVNLLNEIHSVSRTLSQPKKSMKSTSYRKNTGWLKKEASAVSFPRLAATKFLFSFKKCKHETVCCKQRKLVFVWKTIENGPRQQLLLMAAETFLMELKIIDLFGLKLWKKDFHRSYFSSNQAQLTTDIMTTENGWYKCILKVVQAAVVKDKESYSS